MAAALDGARPGRRPGKAAALLTPPSGWNSLARAPRRCIATISMGRGVVPPSDQSRAGCHMLIRRQ
jgi:hypothetical protein